MQETTFPVEIVLAEDCSTDGTRAICEEFATKFPERIRYIFRDKNVGFNENEYEAMMAAHGKYIAYCEGDDFWTDPLKLQKQVEWLEAHLDYSVSFHRCRHMDAEGNVKDRDDLREYLEGYPEGRDIDGQTFLSNWYVQPLTMVFRKSALDMGLYHSYRYFRDTHQIYHLLKSGKGYVHGFCSATRVVHAGGVSQVDNVKSATIGLAVASELYAYNRDQATRSYLRAMYGWTLSVYAEERPEQYWSTLFRTTFRFPQSTARIALQSIKNRIRSYANRKNKA